MDAARTKNAKLMTLGSSHAQVSKLHVVYKVDRQTNEFYELSDLIGTKWKYFCL